MNKNYSEYLKEAEKYGIIDMSVVQRKIEMHKNQEALTLQLKSYPWNFDIIPCFCPNPRQGREEWSAFRTWGYR